MSQPKADAKAKPSELRETIVVVIQALLIALVFRTFLYQPFSIPTASMQSTLMIGDYLLTSKYTWGYGRYSFPLGLIPFNGRIFGREPNRGDIAVFRPVPQSDAYIKRVIGMPGDRIQMINGILNINGEAVKRVEIGKINDTDSTGVTVPVTVYRETLPNGVEHTIQEISDTMQLDNTAEYVVPAGHYFMMGDNRDRSQDSRVLSAVGYVPAGNLIGKAEVRFFSIKDNIPPWQVWQWPANVRLDRMFQSVYQ
ncbi:signal peptidase I [Mariluticola halotolerans]|uniref:signal peptidase I n=1 Tax=Mariluticola halotolerans TaxID=2909283 RepID=UPI0026E2A533|nr:signal peptidase I [Mariluticola halotolerans]UJQ95666.1 signal peptidase I [Mariluticola halotolerans]